PFKFAGIEPCRYSHRACVQQDGLDRRRLRVYQVSHRDLDERVLVRRYVLLQRRAPPAERRRVDALPPCEPDARQPALLPPDQAPFPDGPRLALLPHRSPPRARLRGARGRVTTWFAGRIRERRWG